jgi:hypothetical protein
VDETTDPSAEDLAECPRQAVAAHESIPVIFGLIIVGSTHTDIRQACGLVKGRLDSGVSHVLCQQTYFKVRSALAEPLAG